VHAWIRSRLEELAVLRCLGMRPRELFVLGLLQTVLLSSGGIALGVLLGTAALFGLPAFLPDPALADTIDPIQPMAALRAAGLGLFVALLFALPAIAQTLRVPPALVFRREAEPLPGSRLLAVASIGMGMLGIVLAAAWQSGSSEVTLQFSTAVAITGVALYGAARLLVYCLGRLPRDRVAVRPWARHGLAAGARPGAATLASTAALGLSMLVLTAMTLLTANLRQELDDELPRQAPSAFFVDVQTDQWPQLRALLEEQDADNIHSAPVVTARLLAIDGTPVAELAAQRDRSERWALTREQRLTYLDALPDDNRLVARLPIEEPGAAVRSSGTAAEETSLWRDPARFELSVEEEHARELGLAVGTEVRFEVQGVEIGLVVSSLRSVDWEGFGLNFFMVVEPGPLDLAPQTVLATARVPEASEQRVQDRVVAAFPNVTMLRLRPILERLTEVLSRLAAAVGALGAFTVLAALLILVGTILVDGPRRAQEVALLRTLGMTRAGVLAAFAVEYSLLGAVATLVGCGGGLAASYWVARQALEIEWRWNPGLLAAVATGALALTLAAGLLASLGPLRRRPIAVLHEE
jgi:putative ABC transport system permease protein